MRGRRVSRYSPLEPVESILVADVGNSRIGLGRWDADGLGSVARVSALDDDAWTEAFTHIWPEARDGGSRAIVISSVSPEPARRLADQLLDLFGIEALFIRDDLPLPMEVDLLNPEEVGVDRVCSAAAAFERLKTACAVATFGTAITVDCVSEDGHFLGGAILPGLRMSCRALHEFTARLPLVTPGLPDDVIGRSTQDAILNGVIHGAIGAVRELVERYATSLKRWPTLVMTGGDAALLMPHVDFVDAVVPDLGLIGAALAYRRAAGEPA
ncbi:MAG: hypothetical protein AMXMBFR47_07370 [Planctomycetota bacterium]